MEQYLITPWDTRVGSEPTPLDWDMHVPPEVDAIAEQVIKLYDMTVTSRTLITSKPDKGGAIWRIETNKGPRSLKLLHRNPERSLFSVGLQEYVVQQGARVPALIPAIDGKLFVEMGGKLWIVTDWINLTPATKVDLVGAQELCYGLGEFHRHTKGYLPPFGAKNSSRLYRWPNYYQKIAKKIGWMREMAKAYSDTVASPSILAVVDQYEQQAVEALNRLKASAYPRMVAMGEPHWGLVHQDYGWSNGQNGPGGLWVIDLDGVSYDLPFRDLRKLITSTMDDMGVWDLTWMRGMIDAYHQANPLDAESYEVLLIDMAVPNEFYKHLKEMFFDPIMFLNTEADAILQRVVATDQSKAHALAELAGDMGKYKAGDYEQKIAATEPQRVPSESSTWNQNNWGLQPQKTANSEDTTRSKEKRTEKIKVTKKRSKSVAVERTPAVERSKSLLESGTAAKKPSAEQKESKTSTKEVKPVKEESK
ncbi:CotS family spore coat protein, partial [Brevibacillus choshinensis]|uniref:CotS family spore coat protein n=1 Tax=Brevibacillus choshinensis TaxID=54911 RepID=UPI002E213B7D|nr:CotS family spore coat protein [Brevibacillus choshinensis]